jgi:membrane-associated phospholipid phosphatase
VKLSCCDRQILQIIFVILLSSGFCLAADIQTAPVLPHGDWLASAQIDLGKLPSQIFNDTKATVSNDSYLTALLMAGGASVVMRNTSADDHFAGYTDRHRICDGRASETINVLGGPGFHFAATGLWYAISVQNNDELNKERSWVMMRALAATGLITFSLKAIVNDNSPNGRDWAWPSGHTSSSFAVASVLDEFYGHQVGIPAYIGASVVAYRMMMEGDHWASDIVFGATLGWVIGHTVAGEHKKLELAGFQVLPLTCTDSNRPAAGINLYRRFY